MTPAQCRAARALLGWTQDDLAQKTNGISFRTISFFELGKGATRDVIRDLRVALEDAGIFFVEDEDSVIVGREKR